MQHNLSQAELQEAVEYWLNNVKLKEPCKVESVNPQDKTDYPNRNYVLRVTVTERSKPEVDE